MQNEGDRRKTSKNEIMKSKGEIVFSKSGKDIKLEEETVWLNLNQMCQLFDRINL